MRPCGPHFLVWSLMRWLHQINCLVGYPSPLPLPRLMQSSLIPPRYFLCLHCLGKLFIFIWASTFTAYKKCEATPCPRATLTSFLTFVWPLRPPTHTHTYANSHTHTTYGILRFVNLSFSWVWPQPQELNFKLPFLSSTFHTLRERRLCQGIK